MFDSVKVLNLTKRKKETILSCLFGGRRKFQVTKFALEDSIFVVGSAAILVGTSLEFTAFGSSPDAKYSRSELVNSVCFFLVHNHGFAAVRTHFPGKNSCVLVDRAAIDKQPDKY